MTVTPGSMSAGSSHLAGGQWKLDEDHVRQGYLQDPAPSPSAIIDSGWADDERKLDPGKTQEFRLEFEQDAVQISTEYGIRVEFAEGCSVDYAPVGEPAEDEETAETEAMTTLM